jgi:Pvc16 N-terminal domain
MSQYPVIHAVDETLRSLIADHLDTISTQILGSVPTQHISFKPPHRLMADNTPTKNYLSLFLYRVVENGEVKNRLLEAKNGRRLDPPLALNLFYLITPLIADKEDDEESVKNTHKLLGKVMQIFYDHGTLKGFDLKGLLQNTAEEFRIILNPISMEDMTKLWSSFMRPYYLSVSYEVKVVYIDSEREAGAEQVRRKQIEYTQKIGV